MKTKAKQNCIAGLRFNLQHQGKYMLIFSSSPSPLLDAKDQTQQDLRLVIWVVTPPLKYTPAQTLLH